MEDDYHAHVLAGYVGRRKAQSLAFTARRFKLEYLTPSRSGAVPNCGVAWCRCSWK